MKQILRICVDITDLNPNHIQASLHMVSNSIVTSIAKMGNRANELGNNTISDYDFDIIENDKCSIPHCYDSPY